MLTETKIRPLRDALRAHEKAQRAYLFSPARICDPSLLHVVWSDELPNPHWLTSTSPGRHQQKYGKELLRGHVCVLIPSAVSRHSWSVIFDAAQA